MNISIDKFVDNIRADVMGCPDPAIENAVRDSMVEFCRKAWILQRDFVYNSTVLDAMEELIDSPYLEFDGITPIIPDVSMRPVIVLGVYVTKAEDEDYVPLRMMSKYTIATRPYMYWESQTTDGLPSAYYPVTSDAIRVFPVPTIDYYLSMRVAFKPKEDAIVFDENLYDDWLEEICSGAKYRLFGMPIKPWSDMSLAAYEKGRFDLGVGRARIAVNNSFGNPGLSIVTRSFTL